MWTFTTQSPAAYGRTIYDRAVKQLNAYRATSGLGPVTLDDDLSQPCLAHARYVAMHIDRAEKFDANDETEFVFARLRYRSTRDRLARKQISQSRARRMRSPDSALERL